MTRILVVDDRPINRQFLMTLLNYRGFETREASGGGEGLEIMHGWRPDLAIVDIEMPGMNGIEFVRRLREKRELASIPIIFYTASYDAPEAARISRECGVDDFLMKPSEPELILHTVDKVLGRSGPRSPADVAEAAAAEFVRLHSDALRTSALIEFQLELGAQRRPEDILAILSRAARNVIASEQSVVTLGDSETAFAPSCDPEQATTIVNCLRVPIETVTKCYGWLSLMNREGAAGYSQQDERIARTIAAQAATAYENLMLYEQLRKEADLLDRNVSLLRATIEASGDGIIVVDRNARFVTFNQRFVDIWRTPEEILRHGDGSFEHTLTQVKDPAAFRKAVERARMEEEVSETHEMADGRFIECHAERRTFGGETIGRVWTFRDVTARVQAEEALRDSEEKYRSLIANIPDVTWTARAGGRITFVSANVEAMSGFTSEEIYLRQALWTDRIHPDERDRVLAAYADLFERGAKVDMEYRLQRKDGTWIWVHDRSLGTFQRNRATYAAGICHDITSRKEAEEELRRVARDRELLLESTGEGICAVDIEGRCTMANRVAAIFLGRTLDELIGSRLHDLMHHHKADGSPYPRGECAIYRAFRAGESSRVTTEVFWRKDGTSFPVEYVSSPIVDDGVVRGAVVSFYDVTERRKLERHLEQVSRISSLGRMAATIAHEFNNVLMGIQPFAEVIRRRAGKDTRLEQAASQIINSVKRGKSVTQDILRMTKVPEPALQSVDMTEWLEQLADEVRALVGSTHVDLQVPPRQTLFAHCDPAQLQQVVTNLALNARDAMSGRGTLTISAERAAGGGVRIVVSDTGSGIPADTLPFIFEPLFTTKRSGTGLGLAVAQQLVVHNGGTISVESSSEHGTRFQIDLPEAAPLVSEALDEDSVLPQGCGIQRVVIVEDDPAVATGLKSMLQLEDVDVHVVSRGSEAVQAVAEFQPNVVLIDISLPDMSGTAVYEQISARWPEMAVVFSTGHAEESRLPRSGSKHIGFLRKPYSTETLLTTLREVV